MVGERAGSGLSGLSSSHPKATLCSLCLWPRRGSLPTSCHLPVTLQAGVFKAMDGIGASGMAFI